MITGKQRSYLRSLANGLEAIFRIGKNGIDDELLNGLDKALEARELIKVKILNNNELSAKEACKIVCNKLKCEPVQCIGNNFVIYKKSSKKPKIEMPY